MLATESLYRDKPEWLGEEFEGEKVLGWSLRTEDTNRHPNRATAVGYMVITQGGYLEFDMEGFCMRSKMLNMVNQLPPNMAEMPARLRLISDSGLLDTADGTLYEAASMIEGLVTGES